MVLEAKPLFSFLFSPRNATSITGKGGDLIRKDGNTNGTASGLQAAINYFTLWTVLTSIQGSCRQQPFPPSKQKAARLGWSICAVSFSWIKKENDLTKSSFPSDEREV